MASPIGKKLLAVAGLAVLLGAAAVAGLFWMRRPNKTPEQRGMELATELGCFSCHGMGGRGGVPNPGSESNNVPQWDGGVIMMYAETEDEIREWILDGHPRRLAQEHKHGHEDGHLHGEESQEYPSAETGQLLSMPAYRDRIDNRELEDLVALVKAVSWFDDPNADDAYEGREIAEKYACFGCHGVSGLGGGPNPGSFKGYVPGWTGADYDELVQSDAELDQWILNGVSDRFRDNPAASFFLNRAQLKMPAYKDRMSDEELKKIKAYIGHLKSK